MTDDRQQRRDEELTLADPAEKTQPAEGGRDEAEEGEDQTPATETD